MKILLFFFFFFVVDVVVGFHILILCYILIFSSLLQRYCSYTIFCECILCVVWFLFNFLQGLCDCCTIVLSIWSCCCVRICKCHHSHCFVWHSSNMQEKCLRKGAGYKRRCTKKNIASRTVGQVKNWSKDPFRTFEKKIFMVKERRPKKDHVCISDAIERDVNIEKKSHVFNKSSFRTFEIELYVIGLYSMRICVFCLNVCQSFFSSELRWLQDIDITWQYFAYAVVFVVCNRLLASCCSCRLLIVVVNCSIGIVFHCA